MPLIRIRGRSLNAGTGLCPTETEENRKRDKAGTIAHFITNEGDDFVCVQETGIRSDECPPPLATLFEEQGHHIRVSGWHSDNAYDTVAITVHKRWKVAKVFRMPSSGRCLAVELRQGNCTIFVASVLLPTNVGRISAKTKSWAKTEIRAEARRILLEVERWSSPYPIAIICGDLNCALVPGLDRREGVEGCRPDNVVAETILRPGSRFADVFREMWPLERGWTRDEARLDYALLKAPGGVTRVECTVEGGFVSDHEALCLELLVPGQVTVASEPWTRTTFRTHKASPGQRATFVARANVAITRLIEEWNSRLAGGAALESILMWGQKSLAEAITAAATVAFPTPGLRAPDYRQQYLRTRITALRRMIARVRRVASGTISPRHWLRTSTTHETRLRHVGLHPDIPLEDICVWQLWADSATEEAGRLSALLAKLNRTLSESGNTSSFSERLWSRSRGKRGFFDKYFRSSCGQIESAMDPETGERSWDPLIYVELVRKAVMKPFSTLVRIGDCEPGRAQPCTSACQAKADDHKCSGAMCRAGTASCCDIRCHGVPSWWDHWYGPEGRVPGAKAAFAGVAALITPDAVRGAITGCAGGKSPGLDGVSIDLLKILITDPVGPQAGRAPLAARELPLLCFMADIASLSIQIGRMTPHVTDGLIVMVPKGPVDGAPDVSDMRPITLLSEIGKVTARILADRISAVLCAKPELLNINQRAFLRNGDVAQCVAALLDVFEDHLGKRRADPQASLYCVSYDLSKAFDSVQEYSIRASLERFEFPPEIVDYVCSSLWDSKSSVRTRDGPSKSFDVLSSVRQGDPLAPLIFILVLDVLHCGIEEICLRDGHGVDLGGGVRLGSMGYADDTAIAADSEEGIRALHEWVREFFGAQAFKINWKKTKYICSVDPAVVECLHGVDGIAHISPLPSCTSFRYLGVLLNMDCTWNDEVLRLEKLVLFVRARILNFRIPLAPAVDAINSFLVPKMEVGLGLMPLTSVNRQKLRDWTSLLKEAALNAAAPQRASSVSLDGFCAVTDMANLDLLAECLRMAHAFERVNIRGTVVAPTARARYDRHLTEADGSPNRLMQKFVNTPFQIRENPNYIDPDTPIAQCAERAPDGPMTAHVHSETRAWNPRDPVSMFTTPTPMELVVFTDGSTVPGSPRCGGYAAIVFDSAGSRVEIGGYCKASGMNFLSEMMALLAALLSCPAQAHLDIWTDCLSGKQAVERDDTAERARIRAAARPVLTCIRRALRCRGAIGSRTSFHHVRSHTGGTSFEEEGNALADARANAERIAALPLESEPFLTGEEMFTAWLADSKGRMCHIIGDVRKALRRWAKGETKQRWCRQPHQGATPKSNPDGAMHLCKLVRGELSSSMLRFAVLALCQWLPVGRYRSRVRRGKADQPQWSCPSCPRLGDETSCHAILCPARRGILLGAAVRARLHAEVTAEGVIRGTTVSAEDQARKDYRALLSVPRPGVSAASLRSICWGYPVDPEQALRSVVRLANGPCSCSSGICRSHGWRVPVGVRAILQSALALETDLFASCGDLDTNYLHWLSPEAGPLESPWDVPWAGRFALCAPRIAPDTGVDTLQRILLKAHEAIDSPRPTRIVLVTDARIVIPSALEMEVVGSTRLLLLQNRAAEAMSPSSRPWALSRPMAPPRRWTVSKPFVATLSPLTPYWHPHAMVAEPSWLQDASDATLRAFWSFGLHDRYAGALGVPPKGFGHVLACTLDGRDRPRPEAFAAAEKAVPSAMMALFRGAHDAWVHSCASRQLWWTNMDDRVLDEEIDLRDLRAHQRRTEAEGRKYDRRMARAATRRRLWAHLRAIAEHEGTTVAELLASRPEASDRIPDDLAALVPLPQEPSWAGTLRTNPPRQRTSLNDDYVGDGAGRRRSHLSLQRERASVVRRFGR
jgi:exonuclease III